MLGNRSLQMQVVKNSKTPQTATTGEPRINMETVDAVTARVRVNMKDAAVGFVALYAAVKFINTASEIAIKITPKG